MSSWSIDISSCASRSAACTADSPRSRAPPGIDQVPPWCAHFARSWSSTRPSSAISSPAAPRRPQCACPCAQVAQLMGLIVSGGTASPMTTMRNLPEVVSPDEWLDARRELLEQEKQLTRARDRVNAARRRLPMVRIEKAYAFEGPDGTVEPARPVRGPAAAGDAPLHVRPRLGLRLLELLLRGRPDRPAPPAARPQHHAGGRLAGAVPDAGGLSGADGLGVPVVLVVRHRLQLRLPRHPRRPGRAGAAALPHGGRAGRGGDAVDGRTVDRGHERLRAAGDQRVPAGGRRGVPHLLDLRPRASRSSTTATRGWT